MTDLREWSDQPRRVLASGAEAEDHDGGIHTGGVTVLLVDVFPLGRLQAQLDRIESKADELLDCWHEDEPATRERWSSFTGDELATLLRCLRSQSPNGLLIGEVQDEIKERRS